MADRVRLRRDRSDAPTRGARGLSVLLLGVGVALLGRAAWTPPMAPGVPVEVRGEVARPGVHLVHPMTLRAAVEAAGGDPRAVPDTPLHEGDGVWVGPECARVLPDDNPLLVALPVDVNAHDVVALSAVPGLSPEVAAAIVAARAARPFRALGDLRRVAGVRPSDVDAWAPFLTVGDPGPPPAPGRVDLNDADAAALEGLPGVGPALARRILEERARRPFDDVDALDRVPGIGPALVEKVRPLVEVSP